MRIENIKLAEVIAAASGDSAILTFDL